MRTRPPTTRVSILYFQGPAGYKMKRTEKSYGCTGATTEKSSVVQSVSDCHGFNWGTECTLVILITKIIIVRVENLIYNVFNKKIYIIFKSVIFVLR